VNNGWTRLFLLELLTRLLHERRLAVATRGGDDDFDVISEAVHHGRYLSSTAREVVPTHGPAVVERIP